MAIGLATDSDYLRWAASSALKITGSLTWCGSIYYTTAIPTNDCIVSLEGGAGETEAENSSIFLYNAGPNITYIHEYGSGSNEAHSVESVPATDTWHRYVICRDNSANTVKIYRNGSQVGSTFNYTNDPTCTGSTMILSASGRSDTTRAIPTVRVAEWGLWDVSLNEQSCVALSDFAGPLVFPSNLVAYAPFIRDETQDVVLGSVITLTGSRTVQDHPRVYGNVIPILGFSAATAPSGRIMSGLVGPRGLVQLGGLAGQGGGLVA